MSIVTFLAFAALVALAVSIWRPDAKWLEVAVFLIIAALLVPVFIKP